MTGMDEVRRTLAALSPDELAAIGRNREAVERVMGRAVNDLGWSGTAALLRSVATRMEAREAAAADNTAGKQAPRKIGENRGVTDGL